MTNEEKLDYLIGQVSALKTFCIALIATHPNPEKIHEALHRTSEISTAKTLASAASEPMLNGLEGMLSVLLHAAEREAQRRSSRAV